jgi:hypothetical protein
MDFENILKIARDGSRIPPNISNTGY